MLQLFKEICPPNLLSLDKKIFARFFSNTFVGPFTTWGAVRSQYTGYTDSHLLSQIFDAGMRVKSGTAKFEIDGVLFDEIKYSWSATTYLIKIVLYSCSGLSLIDFGGGFGETLSLIYMLQDNDV